MRRTGRAASEETVTLRVSGERLQRLVFAAEHVAADETGADPDMAEAFAGDEAALRAAARGTGIDPDAGFDDGA